MTTLAVKKAVATPLAYAVEPRAAADFRLLLDRHGIPFEELGVARAVRAEPCVLVRLENEFDELYSRYEGRQVVRCDAAGPRELAAGTLWVPLEGEAAVRAALVLEPGALYGVYTEPRLPEARHARRANSGPARGPPVATGPRSVRIRISPRVWKRTGTPDVPAPALVTPTIPRCLQVPR